MRSQYRMAQINRHLARPVTVDLQLIRQISLADILRSPYQLWHSISGARRGATLEYLYLGKRYQAIIITNCRKFARKHLCWASWLNKDAILELHQGIRIFSGYSTKGGNQGCLSAEARPYHSASLDRQPARVDLNTFSFLRSFLSLA